MSNKLAIYQPPKRAAGDSSALTQEPSLEMQFCKSDPDFSYDFSRRVTKALDELGLDLVEIDELQILSRSAEKNNVSTEILEMIETVKKLDSVAFGTFYLYEES
ncbi:MAG: hypothetical protein AB7J13_06965 [Pyrinomonadaceae bacterium]